jgi:alpha-tubulin suppressor-like RCC1 family protein
VNVRSVALERNHACAVTHSGELFTWGRGEFGCLGHEDYENVSLPRRVEQLRCYGVCVVGVSTGASHTLAVGSDGRVYGVGVLRAMGVAFSEDFDDDSDSDESDPLHLHRCTAEWRPVGKRKFRVSVPR